MEALKYSVLIDLEEENVSPRQGDAIISNSVGRVGKDFTLQPFSSQFKF